MEQIKLDAQPVPGKGEPLVNGVPLSQAGQLSPGDKIQLPPGSAIAITTPDGQTAIFYGDPNSGANSFIYQGVRNGVVILVLYGGGSSGRRVAGSASGHAAAGVSPTKPKTKPLRSLWGKGQGRFQTKGKYAAATVVGTWWYIADYPTGTYVRVKRGIVSVRDLVNKKTIRVTAGKTVFVSKTKIKPHKKK